MSIFSKPNVEELKETRDVRGLMKAVHDPTREVREEAWSALEKLAPKPVDELIEILGERRSQSNDAAMWLGRVGDERALEPLLAALTDRRSGSRREAAESLGRLGDPRAIDALVAALREGNQSLRVEAAVALGKLGDRGAVEPLVAALRDRDGVVRGFAAQSLGQIGDPRAVEPLIANLLTRIDDSTYSTARALGQLGDERAIEPLTRVFAARRATSQDRSGVAWALEQLAAEGLEAVMPEAPEVGAPGEAAVAPLRGGLDEPYCSERCYELGGQTITRELLSGWEGDCSVCRTPIKLAVGGRASMVCYRPGEFLYFCGEPSCVEAVKKAVDGNLCVVCGDPAA